MSKYIPLDSFSTNSEHKRKCKKRRFSINQRHFRSTNCTHRSPPRRIVCNSQNSPFSASVSPTIPPLNSITYQSDRRQSGSSIASKCWGPLQTQDHPFLAGSVYTSGRYSRLVSTHFFALHNSLLKHIHNILRFSMIFFSSQRILLQATNPSISWAIKNHESWASSPSTEHPTKLLKI